MQKNISQLIFLEHFLQEIDLLEKNLNLEEELHKAFQDSFIRNMENSKALIEDLKENFTRLQNTENAASDLDADEKERLLSSIVALKQANEKENLLSNIIQYTKQNISTAIEEKLTNLNQSHKLIQLIAEPLQDLSVSNQKEFKKIENKSSITYKIKNNFIDFLSNQRKKISQFVDKIKSAITYFKPSKLQNRRSSSTANLVLDNPNTSSQTSNNFIQSQSTQSISTENLTQEIKNLATRLNLKNELNKSFQNSFSNNINNFQVLIKNLQDNLNKRKGPDNKKLSYEDQKIFLSLVEDLKQKEKNLLSDIVQDIKKNILTTIDKKLDTHLVQSNKLRQQLIADPMQDLSISNTEELQNIAGPLQDLPISNTEALQNTAEPLQDSSISNTEEQSWGKMIYNGISDRFTQLTNWWLGDGNQKHSTKSPNTSESYVNSTPLTQEVLDTLNQESGPLDRRQSSESSSEKSFKTATSSASFKTAVPSNKNEINKIKDDTASTPSTITSRSLSQMNETDSSYNLTEDNFSTSSRTNITAPPSEQKNIPRSVPKTMHAPPQQPLSGANPSRNAENKTLDLKSQIHDYPAPNNKAITSNAQLNQKNTREIS